MGAIMNFLSASRVSNEAGGEANVTPSSDVVFLDAVNNTASPILEVVQGKGAGGSTPVKVQQAVENVDSVPVEHQAYEI